MYLISVNKYCKILGGVSIFDRIPVDVAEFIGILEKKTHKMYRIHWNV